jgi:hypothetical protein
LVDPRAKSINTEVPDHKLVELDCKTSRDKRWLVTELASGEAREQVSGDKYTKDAGDDGGKKKSIFSQIFRYVLIDQAERNVWGEGPVRYGRLGKEYSTKDGLFAPRRGAGSEEVVVVSSLFQGARDGRPKGQ